MSRRQRTNKWEDLAGHLFHTAGSRRVQKDWLETIRLLLPEGFDVVWVTAYYQGRELHLPASRPLGWLASAACARADSPRRRECPSHPNRENQSLVTSAAM